MGKNKKENFIFTLICCMLMVLGMTIYNMVLRAGWHSLSVKSILLGALPIFFIALIVDWFLVGKLAKSIVAQLVNKDTLFIKKILLISFFMVCGMCTCMTLITLILHQGFSSQFPVMFARALVLNFIFALPLQLIIVGPIARAIFFKLYPAK